MPTPTVEPPEIREPGKVQSIRPAAANLHTKAVRRRKLSKSLLTMYRRLGYWSSASLVFGTALIFASLGFFSFLWLSNTDNPSWRRIVLADWVTRFITIASLVLRFAIATQAATCTSMVAAILLSSFEVSLPNAAAVSLIRVSNNGPASLLMYLDISISRKRPYNSILLLVMLILATNTLCLQFTSTALLSDVGAGNLPVVSLNQIVRYGITSNSWGDEANEYFRMRPATFPAFAEIKETLYPSAAEFAQNHPEFRDTGRVTRAFIPFKTEAERSAILQYTGPATLFKSRVICTRPLIKNATLSSQRISGLISYSLPNDATPFSGARIPSFYLSSQPFNCTFEVSKSESSYRFESPPPFVGDRTVVDVLDWPAALCKLPVEDFSGVAFVLLNTTGPWHTVGDGGTLYAERVTSESYVSIGATTNRREWLEVPLSSTGWTSPEWSLKLTMCFTTPDPEDFKNVSIRRVGDLTLPVAREPSWRWSLERSAYETKQIQTQLGGTANMSTLDERGIFSLFGASDFPLGTDLFEWGQFWDNSVIRTFPDGLVRSAFQRFVPEDNSSLILCNWCKRSQGASSLHSAIFSGILKNTDNPALALQGLLTIIYGMSYLDHQFQFDAYGVADITTLVSVTKPIRKTYFFVVMGLVNLHIFIVTLITVAFCFVCSNSTIVGGTWAAVAQLNSPITMEWMQKASDMADGDVSRAMAVAGNKSTLVGMGKGDRRLRHREGRAGQTSFNV
ncbi:hypothetical protein B0H63DRAFT_565670 [Podospora didyma]|uniref:Uncharacterized protein n=1 Tax=Podospora didyma TaxID=330526 RepID=A0AAE0N2G0_9PEZI|nr:hypothetical protein B0H63DRAFT_565670 [Podospora didyma]